MNDVALQPATLEDAARLYPKWAEVTGNDDIDQQIAGEPRTICQISPTEYILLPMVRKPLFSGDTFYLRMFVALKPTPNATYMDSNMLSELKDLIVHNTLQRLLTMPKQNWTDAEMAGYHAKQYLFKLSSRPCESGQYARQGLRPDAALQLRRDYDDPSLRWSLRA